MRHLFLCLCKLLLCLLTLLYYPHFSVPCMPSNLDQISLLSHPSLLLYQHYNCSWQVYWTVRSNNTTEECFSHSWESTLFLRVGHSWFSAKSIQCFYFGATSRHKNILLVTKSHSWVLQSWTTLWPARKHWTTRWDNASVCYWFLAKHLAGCIY